jgi:GR25 family glycosyltransferase involved in LPS biosynthesis
MLANVISIKESPRREKALQRAKEYGFEICFYDAYNYVDDSIKSHEDEFDIGRFHERYLRNPASGEIGVFMSHVELWKILKKKKQHAHLVLEDDFIPKTSAGVIENIILSTNDEYDVIILGYSKVDEMVEQAISIINPLNVQHSYSNYKVGRKFHESTCGALSYVVKDSFFEKVLVDSTKPFYLIDDWSIFKQMGVNILHVSPLCFYEDYKKMSSNIDISGRLSEDYSVTKNRKLGYIMLRHIYRRSVGLLLTMLMFLGIYSSS